ncbi:ATP-binding cassette domain-containing protein [Succinivibrio dextrinosolvens]|uniref:ATP-binding cassette domain-containing protein n=1 Tax=Succinivibrio dextrinosolvens TaxID=83771 RepID=UPI00241DC8D0|nr:ATP-binding cassette domain-containing protein [Succinivibrio dextrinosolvens]MBE6422958.1 ATP-binding cassette domain-containing protein [Succinivibrio dextrinosolvens]
MSLISIIDAHLTNGADKLLEGAELSVEENERICLVGRNGTGKSTLLSLIEGTRELDSGRIIIQNGLKIAALHQDPPKYTSGTVYSLAATGVPVVGEALAKFFSCTDPHEQMELSSFIDKHDGWAKDAVIKKVLNRIGLEPNTPLADLSGGNRRKAALAVALASEPKLLLLDEPTNHLDIESIIWFEEELKKFDGTIIFVTHDRSFADNCATRIVELDRGLIYSYPGSFSKYIELRDERLRKEELANIEFDKVLAEEEAWIRRGVKARLARNEGRVRDLKHLREVRANRRDRLGNVIMEANEASRSGNLIYEIKDISLSFDGRDIIKNFSATVMRGDRIGITGPNGAGKTTLIKTLLGQIKPTLGKIKTGVNLEIQYFDQYHEALDLDKSVADNVADGHTEVTINGKSKHVISYLANFLFTGRRARSPVRVLSGGEKNRLLLAKLFAKKSNLLIMDEPTNDLDLETLELLEDLIANYEGTVIVISHDRQFIDKVATETWVFDGNGEIESVIGGWSDVLAYYERVQKDKEEKALLDKQDNEGRVVRVDVAVREKKTSGLSFTQKHELEKIPAKVEALEEKISVLDEKLNDPSIYADGGARAKEISDERTKLVEELDALYARWEELEMLSEE